MHSTSPLLNTGIEKATIPLRTGLDNLTARNRHRQNLRPCQELQLHLRRSLIPAIVKLSDLVFILLTRKLARDTGHLEELPTNQQPSPTQKEPSPVFENEDYEAVKKILKDDFQDLNTTE